MSERDVKFVHQFLFEYIRKFKYINVLVISLVVVTVSGLLFSKYNQIQYVAVSQNINTTLYDSTLSNLQINMLTTYMN